MREVKSRRIFRWLGLLTALCMVLSMAAGTALAADEGLKVDITASVSGEAANEINMFLKGSSVEVAGGMTQAGPVVNLSASIMGNEIFKLLMKATKEKFSFSLPLIDEACYEISTEKIVKLIGEGAYGSLLLPGTEEQNNFSDIISWVPQIAPEEYLEAFMPYLKTLGAMIGKNIQTEQDVAVELSHLGRDQEMTLYTYAPDEEQIAEIMTTLADMLEGDEKVASIVSEWADAIRTMGGLITSSEIGGSYVPGGESSDPGEVADQLTTAFENLPDTLRKAAEELTEQGMGGVAIRFRVGLNDGRPALISAYAGDEYEYYEVGYEGIFDIREMTGALYLDSAEMKLQALMTGKTDGETDTGSITLDMNGSTLGRIIYSWSNKERTLLGIPYGMCTVSAQPLGMTVTLVTSSSSDGGDDHIITVDGIQMMMGNSDVTDATLKIHSARTGELESPSGTVTDLSEFSPEELGQLGEQLLEKLTNSLDYIFG